MITTFYGIPIARVARYFGPSRALAWFNGSRQPSDFEFQNLVNMAERRCCIGKITLKPHR